MSSLQRILASFYARADWSKEAAGYVQQHGLDLAAINSHAGILAILPCTFDGRGYFVLDGELPQSAVVIEALREDAESTGDLVGWPTDRPEAFATVAGFDALGLQWVTNPAAYAFGSALKIFRTPLEWLKAGCQGCVPLHHQHIACWLGRALGSIEADDREHAELLHRLLNPRFDAKRIRLRPRTVGRAA